MSKQTINVGTGEFTGDGESIRTAFVKINSNFDEIYAGGTTGPQGPLGFTGSVGTTGAMGFTGSIGASGYTGSAGLLGFTGSAGADGAIGFTGSIGPIGFTGSAGSAASLTPIGNSYYVSENGDDTNTGENLHEAFKTIKHALNISVPGDIILIQSGTFTEEFPLVVPQGVCVKGAGLRATEIKPTTATNHLNGFVLNGESTCEDFTIRDMFYDSIEDTGYAFSFSTTTVVALRSPYIQRVTVLNRGSNPTLTDPYGFLSGDAGRGAIIDGKNVSRNSLQASMLFNEVTFIVPNSRGMIMTNGARSEFLNCFTYFADLAIEGKAGVEGRGNDGKTYIRLANINGTFDVGDTIDYYSNAGDLLASFPIESINGDTFIIDGDANGYETFFENRVNKTTIVSTGTALSTSTMQFGLSSLSLSGTGGIRISENLIPTLGNFNIETWFYNLSSTGTNGIFYFNGLLNNLAAIKLEIVDSSLKLSCSTNGFSWTIEDTAGSLSTSTWYHVSVQRSAGAFIVHLDGVAIINNNSGISNTTPLMNGTINQIGSINGNFVFNGFIDEFRVSNTTRYPPLTPFAVPTSEFVNDNNTLLLLHFNGNYNDDDGPIVQDIRSSSGATATRITRYDRSEFAAELRAFSCANVYGNQGVKAEGADVKLNLIAHNFGYIGTGFDLTNDRSSVVQANEIIELSGGRVYYDTVDQDGNYRIGNLFTVNFETGSVSFQGPSFDISSLTGINFTDGVNTTIVNPTGLQTGNLVISGNDITSTSGGITIDPGTNAVLNINNPTSISGGLTVNGTTTIIAPVPASSLGLPGDIQGLIAFSPTHIYYCTGTFDGFNHIWKRTSWSGDIW